MNPFGPIFKFELLRVARKQNLFRTRSLLVLLLLVLLVLTFVGFSLARGAGVTDMLLHPQIHRADFAAFGFFFFVEFAVVQYAIAIIATATYVAVPLAEEKERQTLTILLTTPLDDWEIVVGKVASRVSQVLMYLLASLPVFAIMQALGGIEPAMLLMVFSATIMTVLSTAAVAAAMSIRAAKVKDSIALSTTTVGLYLLVLPYFTNLIQGIWSGVIFVPGFYLVHEILAWITAGSPITAGVQIHRAGGQLNELVIIFLKYMAFHVLVALFAGYWIATKFRRVIARQSDFGSPTDVGVSQPNRPPVYQSYPILWRDLFTFVHPNAKVADRINRAGPRSRKVTRIIVLLVVMSPLANFIYERITTSDPSAFAAEMHADIRKWGTIILASSLLGVALMPAAFIDRDRRQKVIEDISLTTMTNEEILFQRALTPVVRLPWLVAILGVYWIADFIIGDMSLWTFVLVPPVYAAYVWMAACIGMYFAVRTGSKRTFAAMGTLYLLALLPGLVFLSSLAISTSADVYKAVGGIALGLSPPTAIGLLTMSQGHDPLMTQLDLSYNWIGCGVFFGVFLYLIVASIAWHGARKRMLLDRPE